MVRTEGRGKIREALLAASRAQLPRIGFAEIKAKVDEILSGTASAEASDAAELAEWCKGDLDLDLDRGQLTGASAEACLDAALNAYDAKYRPEMHDVERRLVLDQLDGAWKSHLLTMDHLRSVVGLQSYAQEDPKIAYKREGMALFDAMWDGMRDRVTESIFRIEDIADEDVNSALWANARAQQQSAVSAMKAQAYQEQAAEQKSQPASANTSSEPKKPETIRRTEARVTRNDPCPCGSGKKYKNCHMKTDAR